MTPDYGLTLALEKTRMTSRKTDEVPRFDAVSHPKHYNTHPSGVECKEVTKFMSFYRGNATKYIWREAEKGNPLQDLEKALWYVREELSEMQKKRARFLGDFRGYFVRVEKVPSSLSSKVCASTSCRNLRSALFHLMAGGSLHAHIDHLVLAENALFVEIAYRKIAARV